MKIEICTLEGIDDWIAMRIALWPQTTKQQHRLDADAILHSERAAAFLVRDTLEQPRGYAEVNLRKDYVNGCKTSPVAFLEGIYVYPDARGQGVARLLCAAVENWAFSVGSTELASDAALHNSVGQQMHEALGFQETERVIFYRKVVSGSAHT